MELFVFVPSSKTNGSLLYICFSDLNSVEKHIESMRNAGELISRRTVVCLLCAYAKNGAIEKILTEIESQKSNGIIFDPGDYLTVLYELCAKGHSATVQPLLNMMEDNCGRDEETTNTMIRLIQKGTVDIAYQLLLFMRKRTDEAFLSIAKYFVRQLVKAKYHIEVILNYCSELEALTQCSDHYFNVMMTYSMNASINEQLVVLRILKNKSIPLDLVYFRPLFETNAEKDQLALLRKCAYEFQIQPNAQFLRECVLQHVDMSRPLKVLHELRKANVRQFAAVASIAFECLRRNQLKDAVQITDTYHTFLHPKLFRHVAIDALCATRDFESFCRLVRNIYQNIRIIEQANAIERDDVSGQFLYDAMSAFGADQRVECAKQILAGYSRERISISPIYVSQIKRDFSREITDELSSMLDNVTANDKNIGRNPLATPMDSNSISTTPGTPRWKKNTGENTFARPLDSTPTWMDSNSISTTPETPRWRTSDGKNPFARPLGSTPASMDSKSISTAEIPRWKASDGKNPFARPLDSTLSSMDSNPISTTSDTSLRKKERILSLDAILKSNAVLELEQAIQSRNVECMQAAYLSLSPNDFVGLPTYSALIESFIAANSLDMAKNVLIHALRKGLLVDGLRDIIKTYSLASDVDSLKEIEPHLTADQKKLSSFLPNLANAFSKAGRGEDLIDELRSRLRAADNKVDRDALAISFPSRCLYSVLEQQSNLKPKCMYMAKYL